MNIHSASLRGHRKQNEDKHNVYINLNGGDKSKAPINFYSVYDGHGGKQVSKYLCENLKEYFIKKTTRYPLNRIDILKTYNEIQLNLKNTNFAQNMGSTALVVIQYTKDENVYLNIMNSGDSRCVLCRDNFAIPLTKDHKPHWPEEQHRISLLGGDIIYDGYDWRINDLSVSRAFGDVYATPYVTHVPDIYRYKLDKNDKFCILACDGVWDVLSSQDVVNFILINCYDKSLKTRINKHYNIATQLGEYAIKMGSTDNITIIVVFFS